jgi:hypothetical protein
MFKKLITALFIALFFTSGAMAQEVEVDRYNINARIDAGASSVDVRAAVTISNLSQAPKSRLYFRLTRLAKISGVTVNNAPAQFDVSEDRRVSTLNQVSVTPAASIGGGASATVEISYRIESPDSTPLAHVYQGETFLAPESVWFPMPSTMFTLYGATTAPFTLTATAAAAAGNFRVASAGTLKGDSSQGFVFEQSLNSLPLIVAGRFDQPVATERGGIKIEVYAQPGITSATTSRPQPPPGSIARLSEEAGGRFSDPHFGTAARGRNLSYYFIGARGQYQCAGRAYTQRAGAAPRNGQRDNGRDSCRRHCAHMD